MDKKSIEFRNAGLCADMFSTLQTSYMALKDKSGINPDKLVLRGFKDPMCEFLVIALIESKKIKAPMFINFACNRVFKPNSEHYRKMLNVFEGFNQEKYLTKEQIMQILDILPDCIYQQRSV